MAISPSNKLLPIPLLSFDSSTFTGSYQLVGTLSQPILYLRFVNNSSKDVTVSFDGSHDNDFIPTLTSSVVPAGSLVQAPNQAVKIAAKTPIYIKGAAGTGLFYVIGYYQPANNS
jgi:hypothetical protein